jgi:hypothetical protein
VWTPARAVKEFQGLVNAQGERLRSLNYGELTALEKPRIEQVTVRSRPGTIATIIEPQPNGSVRVVVQGFLKWFLISSVALDGFYMSPDGTVLPMPKHEFYEYD